MPLGTPLEDLCRFAKEVIPAFRDARIGAAAQQEGKLTGILALAILYGMSDLVPELARLSRARGLT
jgi:hypothetical protein